MRAGKNATIKETTHSLTYIAFSHYICDRICENQPHCTRYRNRDSTLNDVIDVWSRSGENMEVIACVVLEIQSLEAQRVG